MNTIKNSEEKEQKWMNAEKKGGCNSIMGCAENKRKKKDGARVLGLVLDWVGSVLGSGQERSI